MGHTDWKVNIDSIVRVGEGDRCRGEIVVGIDEPETENDRIRKNPI